MDFIIGGLAGAGATMFSNPMDVVKTRMQLQGELRSRAEQTTRYRSVPHALYVIGRTDGLLALQKGLVPAMMLGLTMNSVRLGMYRIAEDRGWTKDSDGKLSMPRAMLWASICGIMSGVSGNPAYVVKTRIQAGSHPSIAVGRQHSYKGLMDGITTIFKTEGLKGFFAGLNATCARLCVGSAAQLPSFTLSKEYLLDHGYLKQSPITLAFVASLVSGVVCVITGNPLDVINTRLSNQAPLSSGESLYSGVLDCFAKVVRTEGFLGLYKGMGPFYLRLAPHTTLSLVIWDVLNDLFQSYNTTSTDGVRSSYPSAVQK